MGVCARARTHAHTHTQGDAVGKVNSMGGESISYKYNEKRVHTNMSNTECLPRHSWLNLQIQKHCEWQ